MRKALGLALMLTAALAMPALAEQMHGTVTSVDTSDHSFVLADGTRLWVEDTQIADLALGESVQATYKTEGDKKVVTDLYVTTMGTDGRPFTYYGTGYAHNPIDQIQSGD
jgi:hypothetical protein